jgi:hypothetical protein
VKREQGQEVSGEARTDGSALRMDLGLLAVSACVLTLQVLQTKIFAYSLEPVTIYVAISVCMLGLGASATALAVLPPLAANRVRGVASAFAAAGALAVVLAHQVFASLAPGFPERGLVSIIVLVALALPYLCFGFVIALLLVARSAAIGRAYGFNLAGSGLGCLIVFPLLDGFGAERALIGVAWMALLAALLLARRRPVALGALGVAAVLLALAFARAPSFLAFPPEKSGQLNLVLQQVKKLQAEHGEQRVRATQLFSRWDRTARIDVYRLETAIPELKSRPVESYFLVQDSCAGSILLGVGEDLDDARLFLDRTIYGAGYARPKRPEQVLVIGLGGGPDVLSALYHGAKRIVGVEINTTTIDVVRNEFADFLGRPYEQPGVEIRQIDGRTFLRSSSDLFDLIQMSGVDTKSVLAAGSLSINENYLYTREAMVEILQRLRDDGVLVLNRFGNIDVHRLATVAVEGLRDLGVAEPRRHLVAIQQGWWRGLLVRRTPFPAGELDHLKDWVERAGKEAPDIVIPPYDWIGVSLRHPMALMYSPSPRPVATTRYFQALLAGSVDAFVEDMPVLDLRAPNDDRPFFFFRTRPAYALRASFSGDQAGGGIRHANRSLARLQVLIGQITVISALFILAPLAAWRWRGLAAPGARGVLTYFACLGGGFMLLEIGLIQRFVLLLGHQSYAITVVIFGLLLGASVGSLLSVRLDLTTRKPLRTLLAGVIALVVVYAVSLGPVFELVAPAGFGMRLALALVLLVLLGALLGVPFPSGMRALRSSSVPFVAWGIGVNGFASVVASIVAVEIAMLAGLRLLLLLAALLYAAALLVAPSAGGRSA